MKYLNKVIFLVLIAFILFSCENKKSLFDANSTSWLQKGDAEWKITNEEIVGSLLRGAGFIMTKDTYKDFELELEFYPDETINSGIFVRCKDYALSYTDCYEINIWDLHPDQKNRTGAVVTRSTPLAHVETLDKWSSYKIKNEEDHLQAWVDDVLVVDLNNQDLKRGPIALQAAEKGTIMFRNVRITKLE